MVNYVNRSRRVAIRDTKIQSGGKTSSHTPLISRLLSRWRISNNLTSETQVPNFLNYIYEDALKEDKPEAVKIIREGPKLMKRILIISLALLVLLPFGFAVSCSSGGNSVKAEPITLGIMANAGDTLIFIADEQGYFKDNGLDVTLKTYVNGLAATDAMLAGEVDLAYATEFVVAGKALEKEGINIITTYSKNVTVGLVGRKDQGIEGISGLRGKKIGLARGTINEFYLGRLLDLNGLGINDVVLVDIKLAELGDALDSGDVDFVVAGSRHLSPIIQQQGDKVFVWPAHSDQPAYGTLVGTNDWVDSHGVTTKRLLKSLSEAEQYVSRNPEKARLSIQDALNFEEEYMASVWAEYQFGLSLTQPLILAMEDEARWMIANNLTTEKAVPNFLDYIYTDGLKSVKPEAVKIIGK